MINTAFRRDETGDEKHEEIRRSSSSFFQKNPRVSGLLPFVTVSSTLQVSMVISSADRTD